MRSYFIYFYSYVTRMSVVCTRMSSVCHSYVLVCHPYIILMYSYVIRMSLICGLTMNQSKYNLDNLHHSLGYFHDFVYKKSLTKKRVPPGIYLLVTVVSCKAEFRSMVSHSKILFALRLLVGLSFGRRPKGL